MVTTLFVRDNKPSIQKKNYTEERSENHIYKGKKYISYILN